MVLLRNQNNRCKSDMQIRKYKHRRIWISGSMIIDILFSLKRNNTSSIHTESGDILEDDQTECCMNKYAKYIIEMFMKNLKTLHHFCVLITL